MKISNKGNWTLIALLLAVAIIVVVAAVYFTSGSATTVKPNDARLDRASEKHTVVGKSMDSAKAVDCRTRLSQIRTGIQSYKTVNTDESNPPTLGDIGLGVSNDYFQCPVTNRPYTYDPSSGTVQCSSPGHEGF